IEEYVPRAPLQCCHAFLLLTAIQFFDCTGPHRKMRVSLLPLCRDGLRWIPTTLTVTPRKVGVKREPRYFCTRPGARESSGAHPLRGCGSSWFVGPRFGSRIFYKGRLPGRSIRGLRGKFSERRSGKCAEQKFLEEKNRGLGGDVSDLRRVREFR